MATTTIDRSHGIPGSEAEEIIAQMGGPVAQRKSRPNGNGPRGLELRSRGNRTAPPTEEEAGPVAEQDDAREALPPPRTTDDLAEEDDEQTVGFPFVPPRRRASSSGASSPAVGAATRRSHSGGDAHVERQARRIRLIVTLLLGMGLLLLLYTLGSWLYILGVSAYDHWTYGPVHLAHTEAVLGPDDTPAHPTEITALNMHGRIVILVAPGGDFSKATTYLAPTLIPRAWGNLDEIVVELAVQQQTGNILVHLTGMPDILHFDMRPTLTFVLLNLRPKPGFAFGPILDQ